MISELPVPKTTSGLSEVQDFTKNVQSDVTSHEVLDKEMSVPNSQRGVTTLDALTGGNVEAYSATGAEGNSGQRQFGEHEKPLKLSGTNELYKRGQRLGNEIHLVNSSGGAMPYRGKVSDPVTRAGLNFGRTRGMNRTNAVPQKAKSGVLSTPNSRGGMRISDYTGNAQNEHYADASSSTVAKFPAPRTRRGLAEEGRMGSIDTSVVDHAESFNGHVPDSRARAGLATNDRTGAVENGAVPEAASNRQAIGRRGRNKLEMLMRLKKGFSHQGPDSAAKHGISIQNSNKRGLQMAPDSRGSLYRSATKDEVVYGMNTKNPTMGPMMNNREGKFDNIESIHAPTQSGLNTRYAKQQQQMNREPNIYVTNGDSANATLSFRAPMNPVQHVSI